jgi:hypothetical protein
MTPRIPLSDLSDEATTLQFPRYRSRWLWQTCAAVVSTIVVTLLLALICAERRGWL